MKESLIKGIGINGSCRILSEDGYSRIALPMIDYELWFELKRVQKEMMELTKLHMEIPELISVNSSNIDSVGYDAADQRLFVGFKGQSSKMWMYEGVEPVTYANLMEAESIGSYYAAYIKPVYKGIQLHNMQGVWQVLK